MAQCPYSYFDYHVQSGETFDKLAEKFQVSVQALRERNGRAEPSPGSRVKIPCGCGGCGRGAFYAIRRGETLLHIARRNGLGLDQLLAANPYLNPAYYVPGQVIVIPQPKKRAAADRYTLAENEGLFDVLRKFDMDVTTFCALNPGLGPMNVQPGQRVSVRRPGSGEGRWYTLKNGDDLLSTAARHGVRVSALLAANESLRPGDFVPGSRVRIPAKAPG